MSARSEIISRRRRVAQMLAERMSTNEIAEALGIRWDMADGDVTAVRADPNNIDYLSPKHALGRLLDNYDTLEREAREQLAASVKEGKMEAANRWGRPGAGAAPNRCAQPRCGRGPQGRARDPDGRPALTTGPGARGAHRSGREDGTPLDG